MITTGWTGIARSERDRNQKPRFESGRMLLPEQHELPVPVVWKTELPTDQWPMPTKAESES